MPAFLLGTYLLVRRKGMAMHRVLGRIYMTQMLVTAATTLFMKAGVGPALFDHSGFIHLFSVLVFCIVPMAFLAARLQWVSRYRGYMLGLYIGCSDRR